MVRSAKKVTLAPVSALSHDNDYKRVVARRPVYSDDGTAQPVRKVFRRGGIEQMYAAGNLSEAQFQAHSRFSCIFEAAHSNGMKAIDYSSVRVDFGWSGGIGLLDSKMRTRDQLKAIRRAIGDAHFQMLALVSGQGTSLEEARQYIPANNNGALKKASTLSRLLRAALDALDAYWHQ